MKILQTAQGDSVHLRTSFRADKTLGRLYTGGHVELWRGEKLFMTCDEDINVINVSNGEKLATLKGDSEQLTSFTVSPDGCTVLAVSHSMAIRRWDWKNNKVTRTWKTFDGPIMGMHCDPTSSLLATGSSDGAVKVWDVEKGFCTHNFRGSSGVVSTVLFHPDKTRLQLCTAGDDTNVRVWCLRTSELLHTFSGHLSKVTALDVSPCGSFLLSAGRDKVVIRWDILKGSSKVYTSFDESLEAVAFVPIDKHGNNDGNRSREIADQLFVTGGEHGVLRVWNSNGDMVSEQPRRVRPNRNDNEEEEDIGGLVTDILVSSSSHEVVAVRHDHNIIFSDAHTLCRSNVIVGHLDQVVDMRFLGSSSSRMVLATNSDQLHVIDAKYGRHSLLSGHTDIILSLDASLCGRWVASAGKDGTARLWSLNCNDDTDNISDPSMGNRVEGMFRTVGVCTGHAGAVGAVAVGVKASPLEFLVTGSQDQTVKLWNVPAKQINTRNIDDEPLSLSARFTVKAHDRDINSICVAPNDRLFATGSQDKTAKIWSTADGSLVGILRGHRRGVWCVQFSPVDQCVATSSGDTTVKLWSLSDCSCVKTFEGHDNSVLKVAFLTRGMQLVSSGSDGLVKLWTIKTNECETTMDGHEDRVWALAVSREEDGAVVASGAGDSTLNLWRDHTKLDAEEAFAKREAQTKAEQRLSNLLRHGHYSKAISLAIDLDQPYRVLTTFKTIVSQTAKATGHIEQAIALSTDDQCSTSSGAIRNVISELTAEQCGTILRFSRDWNTNAHHAFISQLVLSALLHVYSPETFALLDGVKESVEALIPFTERHYRRLSSLLEQTYFVTYSWQCMKLTGNDTDIIGTANNETALQFGDATGTGLGLDALAQGLLKIDSVLGKNQTLSLTKKTDEEITNANVSAIDHSSGDIEVKEDQEQDHGNNDDDSDANLSAIENSDDDDDNEVEEDQEQNHRTDDDDDSEAQMPAPKYVERGTKRPLEPKIDSVSITKKKPRRRAQ